MAKLLPVPEQELIEQIRKHAGKITGVEIAELIGVSASAVHKYARENGICILLDGRMQKRERIANLLKNYDGTKYASQLAREVDVHPKLIHHAAARMGITLKKMMQRREKTAANNNRYFNVRAHENWIV